MNVKEMAAWLQSLPEEMQDAEVEVLFEGNFVTFDPHLDASVSPQGIPWGGEHWTFLDFTRNQLITPGHRLANKKFLELGET